MPARPRQCHARVHAVRSLAPRILEADLDMVEPTELAFEAGQWVSVPFGPKLVRAYSIASTPLSPRRITLCADVTPAGIGSQWFRRLAPGASVEFKAPYGGFVFSRADARRPVFVAEEIGIVPIRSILTELYATGFGRPAALIYWARESTWLAYHAEFESLQRRYPGFAYHPVVGAAPAGQTLAGAAHQAVQRLEQDGFGVIAYVCGGGDTIARVRDALMARGIERKAVKWEKFW